MSHRYFPLLKVLKKREEIQLIDMKGWLNDKNTRTSAVDNSSADTGNEGEKNVEESFEKTVQVDSTKILVEDKTLHCHKKFIQRAYTTRYKTTNYLIFMQVWQTIPFFFWLIILSVKENFLYVQRWLVRKSTCCLY